MDREVHPTSRENLALLPFSFHEINSKGEITMSKIKHGHYVNRLPSPTLNSWLHIIQRCTNPNNHAYKIYGGRGIKVCDRWLGKDGFKNFLSDMGIRPNNSEIDRIDNNGNYEPSNCEWRTIKENSRNRRSTKLSLSKAEEIRRIYKSGKMTMKEIADIYGVARTTISSLIHNRSWT